MNAVAAVESVVPIAAVTGPRLVGLPSAGVPDFASHLAAVSVDRAEPTDGAAPLPIAQLMDMLTVLMMLGAPIPAWMIDALKAAGFGAMAANLTERNVRLKRADASSHPRT
ncbi:MAG: hypothetical protein JWM98_2847 [Thermoleophilia bacterium]|nr:hypothetical protein [Thermoleophilia bacterium]